MQINFSTALNTPSQKIVMKDTKGLSNSTHFKFNPADIPYTPTRSPFSQIKNGIHKINNLAALLNPDKGDGCKLLYF